MEAHAWYALAWVVFGVTHSALANDGIRAWLKPLIGVWYRLLYNIFATVLSAALVFAAWLSVGFKPFDLPLWGYAVFACLFIAGMRVGKTGYRAYDPGLFSGMTQIRTGIDETVEPLKTEGLLSYVRHPLYTATFLLLWSLAFSEAGLATAIWGSLYVLIGVRLEERKLIALYGEAYEAYRTKVPAFIPWKGRAI